MSASPRFIFNFFWTRDVFVFARKLCADFNQNLGLKSLINCTQDGYPVRIAYKTPTFCRRLLV